MSRAWFDTTRPPGAGAALLWMLALEGALALLAPDLPPWQHAIALGMLALVLALTARAPRLRPRVLVEGLLAAAVAFACYAVGWFGGSGGSGPAPRWNAWAQPWLGVVVALALASEAGTVARVLRLTGIEVGRLLRTRLVRVGLFASVAMTLLAGWSHERLPDETGWTHVAGAFGSGGWVAQVFVLVLGATSIAGEATQGTLKMILPHAYLRSDWVVAKFLAIALLALAFAVLVGGAALGHAHLAGESLGDVTLTAEGFGGEPLVTVHQTAEAMRSHVRDAWLAQAAALVATAALGLLVSCLFPSVVPALCAAFLVFAGLKFGDLLLALDQDTLQRFFTWPPERLREAAAKLGQALSEGWDEGLLAYGTTLSLVSALACLLVGGRVLSRRDLHV